ncbi:MAG: NUDIX domain-containing protein [Anaerolineae bacterium]|jgi:8-oxo-dGTP pyrophosphatase MutT (NUDIX family)|nr:NUDIX domain-containing protein [Anaerolineae bacterium]
MNAIRPIAICVFRQDDHIFVFEGYDPFGDETFYRPLGGGIEFGEYSRDAVIREVREEIGCEIINLHYLGVLENVFTGCDGEPAHEIVMVYEGDFADAAMYATEAVEAIEDTGARFKALWMLLQHFRDGLSPLYPFGLLELLTEAEGP